MACESGRVFLPGATAPPQDLHGFCSWLAHGRGRLWRRLISHEFTLPLRNRTAVITGENHVGACGLYA
jgi:hypothetical protein